MQFFSQKKSLFTYLESIVVFLFVFTIPTNLFKTILDQSAYLRGLRVDYLLPKIYLSDLVLVAILIIFLVSQKNRNALQSVFKKLKKQKLLLVLLAALAATQFLTQYPAVSVLFAVRIFMLFCAGILISTNIHKHTHTLSLAVKSTILFQTTLAWYQYLNQKSLLGYIFFGETNLSAYVGIAKSSVFGVQKIIPYGTTAHPNILGGILAIFTLILIRVMRAQQSNTVWNNLLILFAISGVLLTQSASAIIALIIGAVVLQLETHYKKNKWNIIKITQLFLFATILIVLLLPLINRFPVVQKSTSIQRRAYLNTAAIHMAYNHGLLGVGFHNFTAQVETYSSNSEVVRFVQPVHNIPLLFIAETGVTGICIAYLLYSYLSKKKTRLNKPELLTAVIPIALWDHYLLSLQSGILLLSLIIILQKQSSPDTV